MKFFDDVAKEAYQHSLRKYLQKENGTRKKQNEKEIEKNRESEKIRMKMVKEKMFYK